MLNRWRRKPHNKDPQPGPGYLTVTVWNQYQVESDFPNKNGPLISISSPGSNPKLPKGWPDVLVVKFDDIENPQRFASYEAYGKGGTPLEFYPINDLQAARIVEFAADHRHKTLHVHCAAGVSRSVATAWVISRWQRRQLILRSGVENTLHANRLVMQRLLQAVFTLEGVPQATNQPHDVVLHPPMEWYRKHRSGGRQQFLLAAGAEIPSKQRELPLGMGVTNNGNVAPVGKQVPAPQHGWSINGEKD